MNKRSGYMKKNLSEDMAYYSFVPAVLPPDPAIEVDSQMLKILTKAHDKLAFLDGLSSHIPNKDMFISMYVRKEALLSSQIEGTQATLEDILNPALESNLNRDTVDVVNYVKATNFALERLKELPLCSRLFGEIHGVLMDGVRGQEKNPGEFRRSQNWIGGQGSTLHNARYVPPSVEDMMQAMSDMEKYINEDEELDVLIRAALIHYQFETIHPFLDGNGRVGRLMITLFLMEQKVLSMPSIYISYFLKRNRVEYYDRMMEVREKGTYEQWLQFFLRALVESAEESANAVRRLADLHDKTLKIISTEKNNERLKKLLHYIEANPIIETGKTAEALSVSYNTAAKYIGIFAERGILVPSKQEGRYKTYSYEQYLDILREGTE